MRLLVILGCVKKTVAINKEDILLVQDYNIYEREKENHRTYLINYNLAYQDERLKKFSQERFEKIPKAFQYFQNSYYRRVQAPVASVLIQIDQILCETGADKIVLFGGSRRPFCTLQNGEGEGQRIWYQTAWLMNPVIDQTFGARAKICWVGRLPSFCFAVMSCLRFWYFSLRTSARLLLSALRQKHNLNQVEYDKIAANAFVVCELPLQFTHLHSLLDDMDSLKLVNLFPYQMGYKGIGWRLSVHDIIRALMGALRARREMLRNKSQIDQMRSSVSMPIYDLANSLMLEFFNFDSRHRALLRYTKRDGMPKSAYLITDMAYGPDIVLYHTLAQELGWTHLNFQYVSMDVMAYPQMELADRYFIYSIPVYKYYAQFSKTYRFYWPSKKTPANSEGPPLDKKPRLTVFTQPDAQAERYLHFLSLVATSPNAGDKADIYVKLHPRQNLAEQFHALKNQYQCLHFLSGQTTVEKALEDTDICVSMSSSVLAESLLLGKMGMIVDIDGKSEHAISIENTCFPQINFVIRTMDEFWNMIENRQTFWSMFQQRYQQYFDQVGETTDWQIELGEQN